MGADPVIDEIRATRTRISEACGRSIAGYAKRLQELEGRLEAHGEFRFVSKIESPILVPETALNDKQ